MKLKTLSQAILGLSIVPIVGLAFHQPSYAGKKFQCDTSTQDPITYVHTNRGWEQMLIWQSNYFHTPRETRCQIVADRLQRYYDNQLIPYLTSRRHVNGYPVLCIVDREYGDCRKEDVVVTLKPGTDPGKVLRQIKYFRRGAAGARPVPLSEGDTVFYDNNGDFYINLNKIIDEEK